MKKLLIIFSLIIIPISIYAEEILSLDLESALNIAEENSPEQLKAELALESALRTHQTSWNNFLPAVNISGSLSGSDTLLSTGGSTSAWSFSGGVSMSLQLSPSAAFLAEADRLAYELELIAYQQTRTDLLAEVEKAYYTLLTDKTDLEIEKANIDLAQKRWEQSKTNFANGRVSELTVLQAEVSAANLKPAYNQAVQDYETSKRNFLLLIGIEPATEITLDGSLPEFPSEFFLDTAYFLENNIPARFDIKSLQLQKAVLENSLNYTAASGRSPSLSLSAGYTDILSNLFSANSPNFSDNASISLSLSIPVDDWIPGSGTDTAIRNYENSIEQTALSIKQSKESAETEIRNLVSNIYTLLETIELSKLSLEVSKRSYEMTEESFNQGRTARLDVEDAQQSLREAEQQLLLSKSNLISSLIDLRLALNIDNTEYLMEKN